MDLEEESEADILNTLFELVLPLVVDFLSSLNFFGVLALLLARTIVFQVIFREFPGLLNHYSEVGHISLHHLIREFLRLIR